MYKKNIFVKIATLGPIGYLPIPGTVATIVSLFLVYGFSLIPISDNVYAIITLFTLFLSLKIIGRALEYFRKKDPSEIVLDEVVGCLITFCCIPISVTTLAIGFCLFRFFDVLKPLGIRHSQHLYGSLGVVVDDVLAGICANIALQFVVRFLLEC